MVTDENTVRLMATIIGNVETAVHVCDYLSNNVSYPTKDNLMKFRGVGPKVADKILSCLELSRHYFIGTKAKEYHDPEEVAARLSFLRYEVQEKFVVMSLDSSMHEIATHEISLGLINAIPMHPREAFRAAILDNAVSVIFAHNHPSGNTEPSDEDISLTRVLCASGKILQIPVIEHMIITRSGHSSICRMYPEIFEQTFPKKELEVAE